MLSSAQPTNPQYTSILIVLCNLLSNIQSHINKLNEDDELRAKNPKHLLDEWRSLFVPELYSILMTLFYAAIGKYIVFFSSVVSINTI